MNFMNWQTINEYPNAELEQKWFEFMPRSTFPSHYTSPGFFTEPFWAGKNPFAVLIFDDTKIVGVLTGLREDKKINCGLEVRPQVSIDRHADQKKISEAFTSIERNL